MLAVASMLMSARDLQDKKGQKEERCGQYDRLWWTDDGWTRSQEAN
jgi:hypothetical protein